MYVVQQNVDKARRSAAVHQQAVEAQSKHVAELKQRLAQQEGDLQQCTKAATHTETFLQHVGPTPRRGAEPSAALRQRLPEHLQACPDAATDKVASKNFQRERCAALKDIANKVSSTLLCLDVWPALRQTSRHDPATCMHKRIMLRHNW
jgi:small-conductance mechanosensitive channel